MKEELIYRESQTFRQWWLMGLVLLLNLWFIFVCIRQLTTGIPYGSNPMSDAHLIAITVIVLLFTSSLFFLRLHTVINKEGIYIRLFPLVRSKFIPWESIENFTVKKTNPLVRHGGWGIRIGISSKAYVLAGSYVLELKLKKRKTLVIGTRHPQALAEFLEKLDAERR